jgi:hypothetical protein
MVSNSVVSVMKYKLLVPNNNQDELNGKKLTCSSSSSLSPDSSMSSLSLSTRPRPEATTPRRSPMADPCPAAVFRFMTQSLALSRLTVSNVLEKQLAFLVLLIRQAVLNK